MRTKREKIKILAIVLLILGIGMFYSGFQDGTKFSKENIKVLKGTLRTFRFDDLGRSRYDYMIYLNESQKAFQITATLIDYFDKNRFIESFSKNDSIEIAFIELPGLILPDRNVLLSVKGHNNSLLWLNESYERMKNEGSILRILSPILIFGGIIILIIQKKRKAAANTQYSQ